MIEVGNTPLLKVDEIFAKLECTNPLGSIKDRMVKYIIEQSERLGLLRPGMTIVEASSGNTGIALSYFAKEKGYSVIIVMPRNMTSERKRVVKKLGAKLVLCSEGDFVEAMSIRDKLAQNKGYFSSNQFSNPLNVRCHYETTAQEILDQIRPHSDNIGAFVCGVGTGGTLIGCGKRLKEAFADMKIVAIEPSESSVMSGGEPGFHGIGGIGDGFIPALVSNGMGGLNELIDDVMCVSTSEARRAAKYLAEEKAMCVGMSAGANFVAAKRVSEKYGTTVTIFPDGFLNYRSQGLTRVGRGPCPNRKRCNCVVKQMYLHENPGFDCDCS